MKTCTKCGIDKPETDFYKKKDKREARCKECQKDRPKGAVRRRLLAYKYGVTEEWYQERWNLQGGVCASCGQPETSTSKTGEIKKLAVDHNHETGENRELLCQKCNTALGLLNDDGDTIEALLQYRRRF